MKPISEFKKQAAKRLRTDSTDAEAILWRHLRKLEVRGSHFRRQVVIGPYIADFACLAQKLIIEIDGSQHGDPKGLQADARRTKWLEDEGYRVIRFWNNDVIARTNQALEAINNLLPQDAHPTPRA